ncbi:hypothetical protein [Mycobacterium intracellulare]|uniref:Uncharacterized protein n=1 Tax=Mycobacterium intracellulare subsp. chimaera TaxID=222805 RepID=A0ABT7P9R7_MYCIT|nr:hypothetical protein [Mycobacterium intracellulare]MCA2312050.1 hypothetical protein [Mycobacterium intracellulare subsp. chimaera]MCA2354545.1 hypothetical protein [Mycobacterium intracellulare subsp. chimaera]MCF1813272.1 hypothetical protein [Mycobacterium intracellulare subsp. intracellulare]MCV7327162.1 hypothetical protein [Mycobacterium intracellulare subsp. chimaera]MDM3930027.1 hypothetical protein [Mycobacterium intracellulare subsp. chimaera]
MTGPNFAAESMRHLLAVHHAQTPVIGMVFTAVAVVLMPILGQIKHRLGGTAALGGTAGEDSQYCLCAPQAVAALVRLAVTARRLVV